jgi:hypothetical protein
MGKAGGVQPLADRTHHAVHHAAGGHHVGTRPGVDHGLPALAPDNVRLLVQVEAIKQ